MCLRTGSSSSRSCVTASAVSASPSPRGCMSNVPPVWIIKRRIVVRNRLRPPQAGGERDRALDELFRVEEAGERDEEQLIRKQDPHQREDADMEAPHEPDPDRRHLATQQRDGREELE